MTVPSQRHAHGEGCLLDPSDDEWVCPQQRAACSGDPCTCGLLVTPWSHATCQPGNVATGSPGPPA